MSESQHAIIGNKRKAEDEADASPPHDFRGESDDVNEQISQNNSITTMSESQHTITYTDCEYEVGMAQRWVEEKRARDKLADPKSETMRCQKCNGTQVYTAVWVNANTDEHLDDAALDPWCEDCEEHVALVVAGNA